MSRPPRDPALGRRRLLGGVAVAGAFGVLLALAPPIATAAGAGDDPPVLRQRITDVARRLGPLEKEEVATELERIETEDGVRLFVVLVDSTGERTATELARAAAEASSLGGNEALLLIAFDQPSDALWVGPSLGQVTSAEIQRILTEHVERNLASGDVEQALLDGAYAVGVAATGDLGSIGSAPPARSAGPVPMTQGNEGRRQPGISPSDVVPAILVLAIVAVVRAACSRFGSAKRRARGLAADRLAAANAVGSRASFRGPRGHRGPAGASRVRRASSRGRPAVIACCDEQLIRIRGHRVDPRTSCRSTARSAALVAAQGEAFIRSRDQRGSLPRNRSPEAAPRTRGHAAVRFG